MRLFIWFVECLFLSVPSREKEQAAREEVDKKEVERQVWFQALPDWKKRLIQLQKHIQV